MRAEAPPAERSPELGEPDVGRSHRVVGVLSAMTFVAYPIVAFVALRLWPPRTAMLVMVASFVPTIWLRRRRGPNASPFGLMAWVPWVTVGLLIVGAWVGKAGLALWAPVVVNATLCMTFTMTLFRGPPLVERFARMSVRDLGAAELRWCRVWTALWAAFFVMNGATAGVLAVYGPLAWWALYTGILGYIAVGVMFGIEYTVRKFRFGRLGSHPLDRMLDWAFRGVRRSPQ